jgi:hypothetical protein
MEDLGQVRLHPGAFAGREDDDVEIGRDGPRHSVDYVKIPGGQGFRALEQFPNA